MSGSVAPRWRTSNEDPASTVPVRLTVTAVVCSFTLARWPQIVDAVESLRCQTRRPDEIILVIDYNDELYVRAERELPGVRVVRNRYEKGLSGAKNTALDEAVGDVIGFLDDDAVARPDWLEHLVTHLERDPSVAGAGSAVLPAWTAPAPKWFPPEFLWVVGCSYRGLPTSVAPIRNPFGGAMIVRTGAARAAGGFTDRLGRVGARPAGCEETEFCIRVSQKTGGTFVYDPGTSIDHTVDAGRTRANYFLRRCYHEGRSKAIVGDTVGRGDALASERSYTTRTLSTGVARGVADAARGESSGLGRAGMIVTGFAVTVAGYLHGRLVGWRTGRMSRS